MSTSSNAEFFSLLDSVLKEQTFSVKLTDNKPHTFKLLSTAQLKELVKTIVDSPITLVQFNSVSTNVMKECFVEQPFPEFSIVDRLLFLLETRIASLGETITLVRGSEETQISLIKILANVRQALEHNAKQFEPVTFVVKPFTVTVGVPLISVESQATEEIYVDLDTKLKNIDQFRTLLGDTFIFELSKCLHDVKINDVAVDLSKLSFKERVQLVEKLPATVSNEIISFAEKYKKTIADGLVINGELSLPIDGTLFSLR